MEKLKLLSKSISNDIARSGTFDIDAVAMLIYTRIKSDLISVMDELSNRHDENYRKLIKEASKYKIGSYEYNTIAFKISEAKKLKAQANRMANEVLRNEKYHRLVKFAKLHIGDEQVNKFLNEIELEVKVY